MLSIIIPCYNMEQYIERCYNSLSIQRDASDVEFIFVNDGSKDNTLNILRELERNDSRVVVIDQDNAGVSAARNRALEVVRGNYIYLLDGDDYLSEDSICEIKRILKEYNPDLILPAYNISKNNVEEFRAISLKDGLYDKYDLFKKISIFPTIPQLIYRADIIGNKNIRFSTSIKCGEVYDFTINYMQYIDTIYVLNFPVFNYFQRSDSATHKINYKNDLTVVTAIDSLFDNGKDLMRYTSFIITAFKLFSGFTYNKYVKCPIEKQSVDSIMKVLSNSNVQLIIKHTAYKFHKSTKERFMAIYMHIMPKRFGFIMLNKIINKLK